MHNWRRRDSELPFFERAREAFEISTLSSSGELEMMELSLREGADTACTVAPELCEDDTAALLAHIAKLEADLESIECDSS